MEYKDYYKILGVDKDASKDEIQRAYRKLARKLHPDVNKAADAQNRFVEINEAYEVLKDPEKRKHYDQYGKYWQEAGRRPPPGWGAEAPGAGGGRSSRTFHFGGGDFNFQGGDFSDFFKDLFGGGFASTGGKGTFDFQYGQRGRTSEAELTITLEEAFHGATKTISLQNWEGGAAAARQPRLRTLQVKIPRGVTNGSVIRLAGQGEKGTSGMQSGDMLLTMRIAPHRMFRVVGHDLFTTVSISPWEAALGGKVNVKTVGGEVNLTIPPGTQSGKRFRLKGKGLPRQSGGAGDMIVATQIHVPRHLSSKEKKLFENLAEQSSFNPRRRGGQKASDSEEI